MATSSTSTRKRDAMGRFLPKSGKPSRAPRARDEFGRFLPKGVNSNQRVTKKRPPRSKKSRIKQQVTHIALVLDNSGSMLSHQRRAQEAYNDICETIRKTAEDSQQDVRVSFYTFGQRITRKFFSSSPDRLPNLNYNPREHSTRLYEAIQVVSAELGLVPNANDENVSFLVQIITDGLNNRWDVTDKEVSRIIENNQATDRWTYAISCPEQYASSIQSVLCIPEGNVSGWDVSNHQAMRHVGGQHSAGVTRFMSARKLGSRSIKNFFAEVNVGRDSIADVKNGLIAEDKSRFRTLTVDKASKIKEFIESKNLTFEKGRVFYQLNKPEIVQPYKEILLQEKSNPKVFYGGDQVREKLGIPKGREGKVSPGNLGEWNIWIQSTSTNRNLLAKMKLLYDKRDTIPTVPFRKY